MANSSDVTNHASRPMCPSWTDVDDKPGRVRPLLDRKGRLCGPDHFSTSAEAPHQQRAIAVYQRIDTEPLPRMGGKLILPPQLCQFHAAQLRSWSCNKVIDRFCGKNGYKLKRGYQEIAATVILQEWFVSPKDLTADAIRKVKRQIQRYARNRIKVDHFGFGCVDISYNRDAAMPGVKGYQIHVHFALWVDCSSVEEACAVAEKAFKGRSGTQTVIYDQVKAKPIYDMAGWLLYCTAPMMLDVHDARSSWRDGHERRKTKSEPMSDKQLEQIARVRLEKGAEDIILRIGLRQEGKRLVRLKRDRLSNPREDHKGVYTKD